ncbi:MAG: prepilin-type N-terminal cleavage/methylation domain-containing protein [Candidatus Gastranaerophilales bacterium]|nr:prepilin-type N-terminal cleavage/methylation domain-containing protein [Candidatus Gastranaerophilales bacterium]
MKKLGFTLAEVLITLVIIGVIAAMTVPTLMNNTNQQEFRTAFKKAISGLNQALTLHYALEGLTAQDYDTASGLVSSVFKTRMSVIDSSTFSQYNSALSPPSDTGFNKCNGQSDSNIFTTADGMIFCIANWSVGTGSTGVCNSNNDVPCVDTGSPYNRPNVFIDVNGDKKPNTLTTDSSSPKDIYQAQIYAQKVVPYGGPSQQVMFDKQ